MKNKNALFLALFLLFGPATALYCQTATELYADGRVALEREEFFKAIELFKSSLELNVNYLEPLVGLAEGYFALSEYDEALTYIQRARYLNKLDTGLAGIEGRIRLGLGRFDEARQIFESILEVEPHSVDAQFGLAELAIAFGKPANAAVLYEKALRISPQNKRALLSLVLVFDEMGDYEVSEKYLEQVLDFYPENATVHYIAAKHMAARGSYSDANYHANVALTLNPNYFDATLLLSNIFLITGDYSAAIETLNRILSDHRDEPLVWYNLAVAYSKSGQTEDAIQAYTRAFTLQPDDEVARIALENLLLESTEIGDPVRNRFADYHFERGEAFLERNYLNKAMHEFRRGLILTPRSREGRLLFASVYNSLGLEGRYYSELNVLWDLGFDDKEVANKLEIAESLLRDAVSTRWEISQYDLIRHRYRVALYYSEGDMLHLYGGGEIANFFYHLLLRHDKIELIGKNIEIAGFGDAYGNARASDADYFIVLTFDEGSRHFAAG